MRKKQPAKKKAMCVDSIAHTALIMRTVRPGYETEVSKYVVSMVRRAVKARTDAIVKICRARQANPNTSLAASADIGQIVQEIDRLSRNAK